MRLPAAERMCTTIVIPTRPWLRSRRLSFLRALGCIFRKTRRSRPARSLRHLRSPLSTFFFISVLRFFAFFLPCFLTGALSVRAVKRTLQAISHSA